MMARRGRAPRPWRALLAPLITMMALLLPGAGRAQAPMRIVVPFAAGATLDALARLLARHMAEPVVVENRPGGASAIGTRQVVRAAPDGRTLLLVTSSLATNVSTHQLDYDPQRDLQPVVKLTASENFLAVHSGLDVRSVADLRRVARQRPGGLNCAGAPGQMLLTCERLRLQLGGGMVTIPFQSLLPALNALAAGHVDLMFIPRSAMAPLIAAQQIRIIASGSAGTPAAPYQQVPVLRDFFPGLTVSSGAALFAPAGTPAPVVAALNAEINRVLSLSEVRASMNELGYTIVGGPPELLGKSLAQEIEYYRKIVEDAGLKPEAFR